jgi:hypothetical protein
MSEVTGLPMLSLQGPWRDEYAKYFTADDYAALEINDSKGFVGDDLDFLADLPMLRELEVIAAVKSDKGMRHCSKLERLSLTTASKDQVEFHAFLALRDVFLADLKGKESILERPSVQSLHLYGYPYSDLHPLHRLTGLRCLELGPARRLESLDGLQILRQRLDMLGVHHAPELADVQALTEVPGLTELEFYSCRRLADLSPLQALASLRRLLLVDCGKLRSLRPLRQCRELRTLLFYGSTKIEDGDLSVLEELPHLEETSFQNRRHYNKRREDLTAWGPFAQDALVTRAEDDPG